MKERRPPNKDIKRIRNAAIVATVVGLVAGNVAREKRHHPEPEPTRDTSTLETGSKKSGSGLATKGEHVNFRDSVALTFIKNLPEGYGVNPKEDSIAIVTAEGKDMGEVFVDPETHELTFLAPKWAVSDLDALGDFKIEEYPFTDPKDIAFLAEDMGKISGWSEEYHEFEDATSGELFGNVGHENFHQDVAGSNQVIEEEQKDLVKKVQDESGTLHLKID